VKTTEALPRKALVRQPNLSAMLAPRTVALIGASGIPGVWLNLGHGSSGWALACGSARVLADVIGGREPGIDVDGLGIERLSS